MEVTVTYHITYLRYAGIKGLLEAGNQVYLLISGQYPGSWIRIQINADFCGFGSGTSISILNKNSSKEIG
jgi:hypothetical protein